MHSVVSRTFGCCEGRENSGAKKPVFDFHLLSLLQLYSAHFCMLRATITRLPHASTSSLTRSSKLSPTCTRARFSHKAMPPSPSPPTWSEWRTNPPTATSSTSTMFQNQPRIPRLPVPKLAETLDQLIKSCTPLAKSEQEIQELKKKVEVFQEENGIGVKLQKKLEERREKEGMRNWLAEWWDTNAYMAYRDSIVINV